MHICRDVIFCKFSTNLNWSICANTVDVVKNVAGIKSVSIKRVTIF